MCYLNNIHFNKIFLKSLNNTENSTFSKPLRGTIIKAKLEDKISGNWINKRMICRMRRLILLRITALPSFLPTFMPKNKSTGQSILIVMQLVALTKTK